MSTAAAQTQVVYVKNLPNKKAHTLLVSAELEKYLSSGLGSVSIAAAQNENEGDGYREGS